MLSSGWTRTAIHFPGAVDMGWFSKKPPVAPAPDPVTVALDVTLAELRMLGSDLQKTAKDFKRVVEPTKEST